MSARGRPPSEARRGPLWRAVRAGAGAAAGAAERAATRVPYVRGRLEREYARLIAEMESDLKPYRDTVPSRRRLPGAAVRREDVLAEIEGLALAEELRWRDGFASGAVYQGDPAHVEFLNRVYSLTSQANPLHADLWPSISKYEAEIVSMTAGMLGAGDGEICGAVTSGGTESILLAMKTYRDRARATRRVARPSVVLPSTAHPAFDKAGELFGIRMVRVPVGPDFRADVGAMRRAVRSSTIAMVGSAPSFPHGAVDPIADLSEIARSRAIGFHTDACLGGFVLPWARRLGYPVPEFDFGLPGVTSMSADTHKFGYAAKGTSVVLYRGRELRRFQYFTSSDWSGGLYASPTFAGSRPGGLVAACWAAMVATGEDGYLGATRRILETSRAIRDGIEATPGLFVLGDPLFVIAFGSGEVDIYRVYDQMTHRGWSLNGLQRPPAVHICVTLRHTQPGVADRFVEDLGASVEHVRSHPGERGGMAPVYGMAARLPFRGVVRDLLKRYMDALYEP